MKKILLPLLILVISLGACRNKSSNKELFDKYYQINVDACVKAMIQAEIDSLDAVRKCECMIKTSYEIDSTFMKKSHKELNIFTEENREIIDSLCQ